MSLREGQNVLHFDGHLSFFSVAKSYLILYFKIADPEDTGLSKNLRFHFSETPSSLVIKNSCKGNI